MDIIARLKAGRDALGPVELNGVALGLRVLTEQDYQDAELAADALLIKHGTELGMATSGTFENEKSIQLLAVALIDPETKKPVFTNADQARVTLTRQDKDLLAEKYLEHERTFSPSGRNLTEEEFTALLEDVKKNPWTPRLNDLSGAGLKRLITSLASPPSS